MLPFRTDVASLPIVQYGPGQPPFVPQLTVHPQVQIYLPEVASTVVNELGMKAYNNASRMFAYNILSDNAWNNPRFLDLVLFVCDAIACNLIEGKIASPQQGLYDTISQCITMVVSGLMFEFPELKTGLPPNVVDAAMQNVQVCSDLKNKINIILKKGNNMYGNQYPQQMPQQPYPQQPVQQGYPQQPVGYPQPPMQQGYPQQPVGYPQQMQPQQPMQPMGYPQQQYAGAVDQYGRPLNVPTQPYYQQPQINQAAGRWVSQPQPQPQQSFGVSNQAPQQGFVQQNPISQAEAFNRFARQAEPAQPEPLIVEPDVPPTRADWKPSEEQPYLNNYDPLTHRVVYRRKKDGTVIQELEKLTMLDRNKHRTVLNCIPIQPQLEEKATEVAKREIVARQLSEKANIDSVETNYVLAAENFLEEAVVDGYVKWIKHQKKDKDKAYRCYAIVSNPLISKSSGREFLNSFSDCATLSALALRLRAIAEALKTWNTDAKSDNMMDNAGYLSYVDGLLTEVLNSFIRNNLSLETLTIDSFVEDYPELRRYLATSYGDRYAMALQSFDQQAMTSLMLLPEKEIVDVLEYNLVDGVEGVELFVNFVPMVCSFTYSHLTSKELGINPKTGAAELISKEENPVLFNMVESLFRKNKEGDLASITPTYNYLITRDNVRYKLYNGQVGIDCYLIGK